jgi:hypothetical protein
MKIFCVNCEKEIFNIPCSCGCKIVKNHKCDGGGDDGKVDCLGCEREMLSNFRKVKHELVP